MRTGTRPYTYRPSTRRKFMAADTRAIGGAPGDLRGLFAAMRRYLEHLGVKGYTEMGVYDYMHVDIDKMQANDDQIANDYDARALNIREVAAIAAE